MSHEYQERNTRQRKMPLNAHLKLDSQTKISAASIVSKNVTHTFAPGSGCRCYINKCKKLQTG